MAELFSKVWYNTPIGGTVPQDFITFGYQNIEIDLTPNTGTPDVSNASLYSFKLTIAEQDGSGSISYTATLTGGGLTGQYKFIIPATDITTIRGNKDWQISNIASGHEKVVAFGMITFGVNLIYVSAASLGSNPTILVQDNQFTIVDDGDTSKKVQFQVSGVTTATTRTLTIPDASGTIALLAASQAFTNKTYNGLTVSTTTGTLTLANSSTFATVGAFSVTITATGTTALTLPTSGTVATLSNSLDQFAAPAANLSANSHKITNLSTPTVSTDAANKQYVDGLVSGLLNFKGDTDCSTNPNYPAAVKGDAYIVSIAGKIGGASGTPVDIGDWYVATVDNAGGTEAGVGTSWGHIEHNLVGALLSSNNLSDLASVATARSNLGLVASATTDTTNANNISSGTLAAARGGAGTINGILKGNGSGVVSLATVNVDYASTSYVDLAVAALAAKNDVQAATTATLAAATYNNGSSGVGATITLTVAAVLILDGYTPALNDRLLIKNQAAPAQNGLYFLSTVGVLGVTQAVLTRTTDFNQSADGINGALVYVLNGTTNGNTLWSCTTDATITFGTTAINWSKFTGSTYTADETTLHLSGTTFSILTGGVGSAQLASGLTLAGRTKANAIYGDWIADVDGATITLDWSAGNRHSVTLGGDRTIAFSNEVVGQSIEFEIIQDGTPPRLLTWPSGIKWVGGVAPTLSATAGAIDIVSIQKRASGDYRGCFAANFA